MSTSTKDKGTSSALVRLGTHQPRDRDLTRTNESFEDASAMISRQDIQHLRATFQTQAVTSVKAAPSYVRRGIQNQYKQLLAWTPVRSNPNGVITVGSTSARLSTFTDEIFTRFLFRVYEKFAHISTSMQTPIPREDYVYFNSGTRDVPVWAAVYTSEIAAAIRNSGTTYRKFCWPAAELIYDYFKENDVTPQLALKHGFTVQTKYVGFDFAGGIPLNRLTEVEAAAINAARNANTINRNAVNPTNISTSYIYTQGILNAPRIMM